MKKSFPLFLSILSILVLISGCSFNLSLKTSQGIMDVEFSEWQVDKEKTIRTPGNKNEISINYSNFKLKEGELVLYLFDSETSIVYEHVWEPGDNNNGTLSVDNLHNGEKYKLLLRGREAKNGSIKLSW